MDRVRPVALQRSGEESRGAERESAPAAYLCALGDTLADLEGRARLAVDSHTHLHGLLAVLAREELPDAYRELARSLHLEVDRCARRHEQHGLALGALFESLVTQAGAA